ncbi:LptF/LptG family permease [Acetobacteraceae bacterium ESL0709]|nr:LptF/LptG family permease [Acetobacteraceae bacterium ESL0697]MDF7678596.1 LptF/LptG family permease [Acetobacteraceae bacterium ESL0709]
MASQGNIPERRLFKLIDRYVLRQLLVALLGLTCGAIALIWLTQSLHFVSLIVQHGLSLRAFLHLTLLMVPSFAAVILPVSTFLVILFIYQKLSHDREIVVLSAMGLSPLRLARPALLCGLIATIFGYILTLWMAPASYHAFHSYEFQIRNRIAAFLLEEGVFTPVSPTMTIYIHEKKNGNEFRGVMIQDEKDPAHPVTIFAERGTLFSRPEGPRLILTNGTRQQLDRHSLKINELQFENDTLDLTTSSSHKQLSQDATELPLKTLLSPPGDTPVTMQNKLKVEGWNRLIAPLFTLAYSVIGVVFILRSRFSRYGSFMLPLIAILGVVGLLTLSLMFKSMAQRHIELVSLLALEAILPTLTGLTALAMMSRGSRRTPP